MDVIRRNYVRVRASMMKELSGRVDSRVFSCFGYMERIDEGLLVKMVM